MFKDRTSMALGFVAAIPLAALAQESNDDDVIKEIIVTAQKRETSLQDVPFSVAALSSEQIRDSGSSNIVELARNVSGLAITDLGSGQSQVAIRGISAGQVVRDQPGVKEQVGVYLDESPISTALFTPDLELFDLERFEVLRGPQGTLFGAGSLAGTLRYITAQPQLGEMRGLAEVSMNDGSESDFGGAVKGMVNLPLGETTALRIAAYYDQLSGFIDAVQPNGTIDKDVDDGKKTGGRATLLYQPTDNLAITPRVVYQKLDTNGFPRIDIYNILANPFTTSQPPVTLGEREQFTQLQEGLVDDFTLTDVKVDYDFGELRLTSVSSYLDREVTITRDATSLTGSVTFQLGAVDAVRLNSPLIDATDLQSFSQELRLSSTGESELQWLVGAFYQDADRKYGQSLPTIGWDAATGIDNTTLNAPRDNPFFSRLSYDFRQFALFGEGTYSFTDQWSLTAGARYYDFKEDRVLLFGGAFAVPTPPTAASTDSDGFSPRVILEFIPNNELRFTAQVARGFRLGGINDPLNENLCTQQDLNTFSGRPTWADEKVWNYELGAKTRTPDGRIVFNAAVFYSDIEDLQANLDAGSCSSRVVFNVPKASSRGVEAELFARPNASWDFGLTATYVDAKLDSSVLDVSTSLPIQGLQEGNRLPTSPEFQAAGSVTYSWPWIMESQGFANFTMQYVGSSYTQLADQDPSFATVPPSLFIPYGDPTINSFTFNPKLPSYDIGNLRVGARTDDWEFAAFVNNVWDERAFLSLDRERGRRARVGYLTNQPRTYGISVRKSF
jgi:iron complex outermembrane recepter protein